MKFLRILGYLWATPPAIIGLLFEALFGARTFSWNNGVLEAWSPRLWPESTGARTWGWFVVYRTPIGEEIPEKRRVHENAHVKQYKRWGVLFFPIYIIDFAVRFVFLWLDYGAELPKMDIYQIAYEEIWFERQARKAVEEWEKENEQ